MKEKEVRKLYHSISNIREDYIEEAWKEKTRKRLPQWITWGIAAACLFLGAIAIYTVPHLFSLPSEHVDSADAGKSGNALDGNPNGYDTVQREPEMNGIEVSDSHIVISSYGDMELSACYVIPSNGSCVYSMPLQEAMEEYGDTVLYKVILDVFSDNTLLDINSGAVEKERERLEEIKYAAEFEPYHDGAGDHYYFVLQATQEQLVNFEREGNYGYMFWLYKERAQ